MKHHVIYPTLFLSFGVFSFHVLHTMESLNAKMTLMSLKQTSYAMVKNQKENNPAADKAFTDFRKNNKKYYFDYEHIKEHAPAIIADRSISKKSRIALFCHMLFYNITDNESIIGDYQKRADQLSQALQKGDIEQAEFVKYLKKYGYKKIIPMLVTNDTTTCDAIKNIINGVIYRNENNIKKLEKICSQSCDPVNGLWNFAFLYACSCAPTLYAKQNELVKKIVKEYHPDINAKDNHHGNTGLLYCIYYGNEDLVTFLLNHGADIHQKNDKKYSSLMFAAQSAASIHMIPLLTKDDINHKANDKETALSLATKKGDIATINLLLSLGAKPTMIALINCLKHKLLAPGLIKTLLKGGANVNSKDEHKTTFLMYLAQNKDFYEIIKWILETYEVMINVQNNAGFTALLNAIEKHNLEIADLFLAHGADPNLQNRKGNSALHRLIKLYSNGYKHCAPLLISLFKAHANIHLKNNKGVTPWQMVKESKSKKIIKLFEAYQAGFNEGKNNAKEN